MADLCALLSRSRQQLRTDLDRPPPTFGGFFFFASFYQYVDIGKSFMGGSMAVVMQGIGVEIGKTKQNLVKTFWSYFMAIGIR